MNSSPSYRKKNSAAAVTVASRRRALLSVEDDISEVSGTSATELEVTHEEYLRNAQRRARVDPNLSLHRTNTNTAGWAGVSDDAGASRSCTGGGVRRSFSSLLGGRQSSGVGGKNRKDASSISPSVSDLSADRKTVASLETIKASNKQEKPEPSSSPSSQPSGKKEKKRWTKLKRMIGEKLIAATHHGSASSVDGVAPATENRQRTLSEENTKNHHFKLMGRRVRSSPEKASLTRSNSGTVARQQQAMDDDRIRGRFDGIDILSLGGAYLTVPSSAVASSGEASDDMLPPWDRAMECKFTGEPPQESPAEIVLHAVWASSGRDPPEIILDGIGPGPDGRWSVRVVKSTSEKAIEETTPEKSPISSTAVWWNFDSTPPPQLQPTRSHDDSLSDDDGRSPVLLLRQLLWGTTHDTTPADVTRAEAAVSTHSSEHSDPMLDVATRCSIPIDIDDDTLIISTREHIQALHDLASASIAERKFEHALRMFQSLLKGLDSVTDPDLRFVKGTTLHNMGVLQLWMGQTSNAAATFSQALDERIKQLPSKHPDLAVTLSRKAAACFGVGRFGEAIAGLKEALAIIPPDHLIRAKLLNNLGVIYYFQNDFGGALREFTSGLEIQRDWLEGPVRREMTVYDTAVTLSNMGKVYVETSDNEIASYLYEEALLLETAIFRKDHDLVLTTLTSLAMAKAQKEHFGKALQILQGCLRSQNNRFGVLSAESMNTVGLCSCFHARQGDYENALKCLLTVRKWQKAHLAENHTALMKSKQMQKAIEAKLLGKKKKTTFSVTQALI